MLVRLFKPAKSICLIELSFIPVASLIFYFNNPLTINLNQHESLQTIH